MAPLLDDDGFVGTLSDQDYISDEVTYGDALLPPTNGTKRKRKNPKKSAVKKQKVEDKEEEDVDSDFEFGLEDDTAHLDDYEAFVGTGANPGKPSTDIEAKAARWKPPPQLEPSESDEGSEASSDGFGAGADMGDESEAGEDESEPDSTAEDAGTRVEERHHQNGTTHPEDEVDGASGSDEDDEVEREKKSAFFAPETKAASKGPQSSFYALQLSRPILKGLAEIGFSTPTPIQSKTIPIGLAGKDVVGGAVTGSGKTAAFIIPILERLLYRPKKAPTTRGAILAPTRELALQCFNVAKKLAAFTDITFGQAIGGLNIKEQERQLKQRPDIVIGTPGRFIDLERNSSAFSVSSIEILVLDEADRMLEEGFADELNEILGKIPKSRQTMLFSATMTSKIDDLIRVGLQRPARLLVDAQNQTVAGLVQEFVRLRPGRESKRLAYLMRLC